MASSTSLPTNDLNSPPKTGRFQLAVHLVAKSEQDASTIFSMVKAIQKRALDTREEPETLQYQVFRSADDKKTIFILEEYERADALLKTHMGGEEFKALVGKLGDLVESMNSRFYQDPDSVASSI